MQNLVAMAPVTGRLEERHLAVDEPQSRLLDLYASVLGWLLRQESVGWHRPFYAASKQDSNGVDIDVGRPLQPHEARALYADLEARARARGVDMHSGDIGMVSTPTGVRVIQFIFPPQDAAGEAQWRAGNKRLHDDVAAAVERMLPDATGRLFASSGNLVTNDWKENPDGQAYVEGSSAAGRPDVFGWAAGVLAPRVQAVFEDFSQRYDWGDPGRIRFQRAGGPDVRGQQPGAVPAQQDAAPTPSYQRVAPPAGHDGGGAGGSGAQVSGAVHYGKSAHLQTLRAAPRALASPVPSARLSERGVDPRIKRRV
jgi:hypothetical protein